MEKPFVRFHEFMTDQRTLDDVAAVLRHLRDYEQLVCLSWCTASTIWFEGGKTRSYNKENIYLSNRSLFDF